MLWYHFPADFTTKKRSAKTPLLLRLSNWNRIYILVFLFSSIKTSMFITNIYATDCIIQKFPISARYKSIYAMTKVPLNQ